MSERFCVLITNDDGVDAPGIHALMVGLLRRGISFVAVAPLKNQSACSMSMTLQKPMEMREHPEILEKVWADVKAGADSLGKTAEEPVDDVEKGPVGGGGVDEPIGRIFSLEGTPSDCMIVGLSGSIKELTPNMTPTLCISGINLGANVSVDVLHSGTIAGAREASLYGIPALATSLDTFDLGKFESAVESTIIAVEKLLEVLPLRPENLLRPNRGWLRDNAEYEDKSRLFNAFMRGDVFLSLNTPPVWNGVITPTKIGMRWYRNALHREDMGEGNFYSIDGVTVIDDVEKHSDVGALAKGEASLTVICTWPEGHPLELPGKLLRTNFDLNDEGWPIWLS